MPETIRGNLFDFPQYYDLIYRADCRTELAFLLACFERHARRRLRRVFEPACGTGRLLLPLARRGFQVAGCDLNPRAIAYCNERLARHGFPRTAWVADMADFRVSRKVDAAFNLINTFRHLLTDADALAHLCCMARSLATGGLYVLGLHLTPTRGPVVVNDESWSARRGRLAVDSYMWTITRDRRRRLEVLGMTFDVTTPTRRLCISDEMHYRIYTARQMTLLLSRVHQFDVVETYDFCYEIEHPIVIGARTEDVIYILRRR